MGQKRRSKPRMLEIPPFTHLGTWGFLGSYSNRVPRREDCSATLWKRLHTRASWLRASSPASRPTQKLSTTTRAGLGRSNDTGEGLRRDTEEGDEAKSRMKTARCCGGYRQRG